MKSVIVEHLLPIRHHQSFRYYLQIRKATSEMHLDEASDHLRRRAYHVALCFHLSVHYSGSYSDNHPSPKLY